MWIILFFCEAKGFSFAYVGPLGLFLFFISSLKWMCSKIREGMAKRDLYEEVQTRISNCHYLYFSLQIFFCTSGGIC